MLCNNVMGIAYDFDVIYYYFACNGFIDKYYLYCARRKHFNDVDKL